MKEPYFTDGETKAQRNQGLQRCSQLTNSEQHSQDPNPGPSDANHGWSHLLPLRPGKGDHRNCPIYVHWNIEKTVIQPRNHQCLEHIQPARRKNRWKEMSWEVDSGPAFASLGDKGYSRPGGWGCVLHPTQLVTPDALWQETVGGQLGNSS